MTATTTGPLVWTDDEYDRAYASDGISRFGAYLHQRRAWFDLADGDNNGFAAMCWQIATSPIMAPGYLRHRHDISAITALRSDDDGSLIMRLSLPLTHHQLANRTALGRQRARDWATERIWGTEHYQRHEPYTITEPTVLTSAAILLPVPNQALPDVPNQDADLTACAKNALTVLANYTATHAAPVIDALTGDNPH